jgi:hypothetical protein
VSMGTPATRRPFVAAVEHACYLIGHPWALGADTARPPASRVHPVTARFRAGLTLARGLLPSSSDNPAEGMVGGERGWPLVVRSVSLADRRRSDHLDLQRLAARAEEPSQPASRDLRPLETAPSGSLLAIRRSVDSNEDDQVLGHRMIREE